jgi:glycosyltransferase involved in cell wall biosynthesis
VTTFHDLLPPYLFPKAGPLRGLAVRLLLATSHGTVYVEPSDLARVGKRPNRRWIPIGSNIPCAPPSGFDRVATRRQLGARPGDLLVGFFGLLTPSKGGPALIEALGQLRAAGRSARLALIGAPTGASNSPTDQGGQEQLERTVAQLGLASVVVRTGFLEPSSVSAHLLACDVVALPYLDGASFRRGSLLAALEHACPVVTTTPAPHAAGAGPRLLIPGQNLLAVPPNDPAARAATIARLADDRPLAERLGQAGRAVAAACSWDAIAAETLELYRLLHRD